VSCLALKSPLRFYDICPHKWIIKGGCLSRLSHGPDTFALRSQSFWLGDWLNPKSIQSFTLWFSIWLVLNSIQLFSLNKTRIPTNIHWALSYSPQSWKSLKAPSEQWLLIYYINNISPPIKGSFHDFPKDKEIVIVLVSYQDKLGHFFQTYSIIIFKSHVK
jgi:hypothetical protein